MFVQRCEGSDFEGIPIGQTTTSEDLRPFLVTGRLGSSLLKEKSLQFCTNDDLT